MSENNTHQSQINQANQEKKTLKPKFRYLVIPSEIVMDENLSWLEKNIWSVIHSLEYEHDDGCFATNEYFSSIFKVTDRQIRDCINNLIKLGYIHKIKFDGKHRYLKTTIQIKINSCMEENFQADRKKTSTLTSPPLNNPPNIYINNNINNNPASEAAVDIFNYFVDKYKQMRSERKLSFSGIKPTKTQYNSIESLLKKHSSEYIKKIIDVSLSDKFWYKLVTQPSYLKTKFETLETLLHSGGNIKKPDNMNYKEAMEEYRKSILPKEKK